MLIFSVLAILSLTGCAVPFFPEVPPSSYSLDAAINVLAGKYYLLDSGHVEGFGGIELGQGRYATFADVDGILLVFKYESEEEAKERWGALTKKYGNPFRLKYFKISMGNYGVFTVRLEKSDLYAWYKDNWLIIVNGDNVERFVQDVNNIYKTIRQ
ncbi:hypothetical protein A4H02_07000 [Fervidobacterium thailandense]|uniref:DUF3242 domain-containing protein n=2 Tax=Fervidobacterium thailandense TaxID=1008305 RepID=A0A1E3G1R3_9BACT|nr:hypothetical protein A4H02_07000 [Fervidobacterium thailandense]